MGGAFWLSVLLGVTALPALGSIGILLMELNPSGQMFRRVGHRVADAIAFAIMAALPVLWLVLFILVVEGA